MGLGRSELDAWASAELWRTKGFVWLALRLFCPPSGFWQFCRLYVYFRWADDIVDAAECDRRTLAEWVERQQALVANILAGEPIARALERPEAALVRALSEAEVHSFLGNATLMMWRALAFDAGRDSSPIAQADLDAQVERIGDAYLLALFGCAGGRGPVPEDLVLLSRAATLVHLVRDFFVDRSLGYDNLPRAAAAGHGIAAGPVDRAHVAPYLRERLDLARQWFARGARALAGVRPWRVKFLLRLFALKYRLTGWRLRRNYARMASDQVRVVDSIGPEG